MIKISDASRPQGWYWTLSKMMSGRGAIWGTRSWVRAKLVVVATQAKNRKIKATRVLMGSLGIPSSSSLSSLSSSRTFDASPLAGMSIWTLAAPPRGIRLDFRVNPKLLAPLVSSSELLSWFSSKGRRWYASCKRIRTNELIRKLNLGNNFFLKLLITNRISTEKRNFSAS